MAADPCADGNEFALVKRWALSMATVSHGTHYSEVATSPVPSLSAWRLNDWNFCSVTGYVDELAHDTRESRAIDSELLPNTIVDLIACDDGV